MIAEAGLASGVPVIFGILTTNTVEQAVSRAGGKRVSAAGIMVWEEERAPAGFTGRRPQSIMERDARLVRREAELVAGWLRSAPQQVTCSDGAQLQVVFRGVAGVGPFNLHTEG
ncbi:MAG: 6,7-dimethyl-8-ribityllumazine synthase, partial [Proteobacteria bacterium]|nr:6,7-dimethyl-8-ribityllumazine synthase [Pseudomonadota bacterium]